MNKCDPISRNDEKLILGSIEIFIYSETRENAEYYGSRVSVVSAKNKEVMAS